MQVRIKDIMVEKGISSVSLAESIGVSKVTVSNLINNKTMPSVDTLEKIATTLDVPIWQLFVSPEEVKNEDEITALISYKNELYKANTLEELKKIVNQLEGVNTKDIREILLKYGAIQIKAGKIELWSYNNDKIAIPNTKNISKAIAHNILSQIGMKHDEINALINYYNIKSIEKYETTDFDKNKMEE